MTARRGPDFRLEDAVRDPGFSPRRADVPALVDLVAKNAEEAEPAARALSGRAAPAEVVRAELMAKALAATAPGERSRLTALAGRIALVHPDEALQAFLFERLGDADTRTRKSAATALGKMRGEAVAEALSKALAGEGEGSVRRALVEALGKAGGAEAASLLADMDAGEDPRLDEMRAKAQLMAARTAGREVPSSFDADKPAAAPVPVVLHCRAGLGAILRGEIDKELAPRLHPRAADRVLATLTGPPARLFAARTMLFFGFPLPPEPIGEDGDVVEPLVRALVSPEARALFDHWTVGPVRFRIAWAGGGKRRASTWRAAEEVARRAPALVNDPTESTWEAVVREAGDKLEVELLPRAEDPRFVYRKRDVPAASHPTIAAALVRVAGVQEDDVVWDPFVGSAAELCERALAGPYMRLVGSDRDPAALAAARENLTAAGVADAVLVKGDALSFVPAGPRPTLVITNPPMGRRVLRGADLGMFFDRFLDNVARVLAPGGRLVWVSPLPGRAVATAERFGLSASLQQDIDMGGFEAQIQVLRKDAGRSMRRPPRR
ncbi:HEAT repeat domain-containing protein [Polyangium aurulentum]|uniref:HEAT repeat domain-containing protein n=1 Tax=Polyangium aurulentum TaxID=2567896 RepID=UPI0010AEE808|nr:HEAT repeat domain-containing protein [Polyangium aurulentum]UQA54699.1 HEAT repeat domain-containing protein [Polyangium aurulentum]